MEPTILPEIVADQSLRDTPGRRVATQQHRSELLAQYKTSGMTQKAFARHAGVNVHTFVSWIAAEKRAAASPGLPCAPETASGFVELAMPAGIAALRAPLLEVVLRDGRIARGPDAAALAQLVRLLEA